MSTSDRINQLKRSVIKEHLTDFDLKLNEVISMGESPIEKLMILQLYNYFQKYGKNELNYLSHFGKVEFIEEELDLFDPDISKMEWNFIFDKVKRYNYRFNDKVSLHYKYIGFRVTKFSNYDDNIIQEIEIRPQSYQLIDKGYYRIDIGMILTNKNFYSNEVMGTYKIALECDGYDYHSSPSQKMEDDVRARNLKRNGWKDVLRYSGMEIYKINDDLKQIHYNFEEMLDILLL